MPGSTGIEAEEAFLELLQLPRGLGLRAGATVVVVMGLALFLSTLLPGTTTSRAEERGT